MDNIEEQWRPAKRTQNSISSIANLSAALDLTEQEINDALSLPSSEKYVKANVPKADGSVRNVYKPHHLIRKIQRRINNRIFKKIVLWPSYIYGSIPNEYDDDGFLIYNKDYINCAAQHCGAKSLLKVDIKDFFDNIHSFHVRNIFTGFFKYSEDVSNILTEICCFEDRVVQGALTSSYIACLCLWDSEEKLVQRLKRRKLVYTRLVDDINVSSKTSNFDFDNALSLIKEMLHDKDLPLNKRKTKAYYTSMEPLSVHGLRINFNEPRLPSSEVRILRSAVRNIQKLASEPGYRTTHAYRKDFNRCVGRVNKLKRVGHEQHIKLMNKLLALKPLPSKADIIRCNNLVKRLERDFTTLNHQFWYYRRFNKTHERLNILQRSFPRTARELRARMKLIKPSYDK
jgi:RNA-directed DNA polymerase